MVTTANDDWVADLVTMTCRNTTNDIVVEFEQVKNVFMGKIRSIPMELFRKWSKEKQEDANINNALIEAEVTFLKEVNNDYNYKRRMGYRSGKYDMQEYN
jgi:hypothetical protein